MSGIDEKTALSPADVAVLAMCFEGMDLPKDVADDEGVYLNWVEESLASLERLGYLNRDESLTLSGKNLMLQMMACAG